MDSTTKPEVHNSVSGLPRINGDPALPESDPMDAMQNQRQPSPVPVSTQLSSLGELKDLTGLIDRDELQYIGGGCFGDVYRGRWIDERAGESPQPDVVIKVLRSTGSIDTRTFKKDLKAVRRELAVWQSLQHQNVVPFVGVALISGVLPSIISAWMCNGTLRSYLQIHPTTSRIPLLIGVAQGLNYLHTLTPAVVHGDLKADNVLIDETGSPRLCDFGLSRMIVEATLWQTSASTAPGTLRWKAPELLSGDQQTVTVYSDIYAYGMTCLEVYTDKPPFSQYRHELQVMSAVAWRQEVPERPPKECFVTDDLWSIWLHCWRTDPLTRPTAGEVIEMLENLPPPNSSE